MSQTHYNTDSYEGFPHTDWSLIRAIQLKGSLEQHEALGEFLAQYMSAMRSHLVVKRYYKNEHDIEDLLADFVSDKIIAAHLLDRVSQGDGRLRTYLVVCLDNFAKSNLRKRVPIGWSAVGGQDHSLTDTSSMYGLPETDAFDLEWAHTVIDRSIAMTREECNGSQAHIWHVFEARLVMPMTGQLDEPVEYELLRQQLSATSIKQVQNWLVTGIRKFQRNISIVVSEYASSNDRIQQEIGELFEIFRRCPAYLDDGR